VVRVESTKLLLLSFRWRIKKISCLSLVTYVKEKRLLNFCFKSQFVLLYLFSNSIVFQFLFCCNLRPTSLPYCKAHQCKVGNTSKYRTSLSLTMWACLLPQCIVSSMLEIGFLDKDPKKEFYRSKNSFRRKIICCGKNFRWV